MSKLFLGSVSAMAILAATPAWADCATDLQNYDTKISADASYRAKLPGSMRADVRQLRNAAYLLRANGQEEACEEVVAAIKSIVENPEEGISSYDDWNTSEVERLKSAQSFDQLQSRVRADELMGSDIRNMENADLGEIEDVVLATDKSEQSYVIVSHGGFLGLGDKQVAVPLEQLKISADRDVFVLDATKAQLEAAPTFERGMFDETVNDEWRRKNDGYFSSLQ